MKTILVPTDFSRSANNALDYAVEIAKKEKAKIILLHAYDIVYISPDTPIQYFDMELTDIKGAAQKRLVKLSAIVESATKIKCEILNLQGLPVDLIADTVKSKKINLVVMGTKGASGISEVLIGSNTARVIGKAMCPVIAVPSRARFTGLKKIVFATDYHEKDLVALKQLTEIAGMFKSKISVVHVADEEYTEVTEKEYIDKFEKKARKNVNYKPISFKLLKNEKIEKALEKEIKKESPGLLAMSTKNKNFMERLFGKSITKKLAYHTRIPLIVFHYK
jgi:nucleotide-binding universal stress UspA family protein